jgi:hypothetical protein
MNEAKRNALEEKLARIEESITSKGHHMQDATTINVALVDIISIVREILNDESGKDA